MTLEQLLAEIESRSPEEQQQIFDRLALKHSIHPLEGTWKASARVILEAISRASDLTHRGVRGIIAEASFKIAVLEKLSGWNVEELVGDYPYDYAISDDRGKVRIQVKMQRRKEGRPMTAKEGNRKFPASMFVVETQKTRGGQKGGEQTRPYRFGDFDILAVSMAASTESWDDFMFTVGNWLVPDDADSKLIFKFQPVPAKPNNDWTDDLMTCVKWLRSNKNQKIRYGESGLLPLS